MGVKVHAQKIPLQFSALEAITRVQTATESVGDTTLVECFPSMCSIPRMDPPQKKEKTPGKNRSH